MPVLKNISTLATCKAGSGQADAGKIRRAALVWQGERLLWAGGEGDLPKEYDTWESIDAGGRLVIPGLIDCHTHLVFGGSRAGEFVERLKGVGHAGLAARGGGILATVRDTRCLDKNALKLRASEWLQHMLLCGVTAVEVKSGYGLDGATEMRMLEAVRDLNQEQPVQLVSTYLGAHTLPVEYQGRREAYVCRICEEWLPEIAGRGLARFCDAFIEQDAFTAAEGRSIFKVAAGLGLGIKVHAEQLSHSGGAALAAEFRAASADHLEWVDAGDIAQLKASGTVAVDLPLAMLLTSPGRSTPVRELIAAGVPVAVATDFNPGSAPCPSLPQALWLACVVQKLTPDEVLKGATLHAAMALGLQDTQGSLETGKLANFCIMDAQDTADWLYHFNARACRRVFIKGREMLQHAH